jgi:hypothetical protein
MSGIDAEWDVDHESSVVDPAFLHESAISVGIVQERAVLTVYSGTGVEITKPGFFDRSGALSDGLIECAADTPS